MRKGLQGGNGFTLLEVIIALTVFSVGVLSVIAMQSNTSTGNARARFLSEATAVAIDRMEQLMNLDYDDAALQDGDGDGAAGLDDKTTSDADGTADSPLSGYSVYWNVVADTPVSGAKTIRVIVEHPRLQRPVTLDFVKNDL